MDHYQEDLEGTPFRGMNAPCTVGISGASGSGKTSLVYRILKHANDMFTQPVHRVLFCFSVHQPAYTEMEQSIPHIKFHRGLPTEEDIDAFTDGTKHTVIVLDDLMEEAVKTTEAQHIFTKYSHHKCASTLFLVQNLYVQGRCARNIFMNIHYFFLLASPKDFSQIAVMARQTGLGDILKQSYKDSVMQKRYGYLLLSLHPGDIADPKDPPRLRSKILTHVFPDENLISYL